MVDRFRNITAWISPALMLVVLSACAQSPVSQQKEVASSLSVSPTASTVAESGAASPSPGRSPVQTASFKTQQVKSGFASDGQHFLFLESWRDGGAGIPHASLQVVDLATNTCVAKGCVQTQFQEKDAALSLATAETKLLNQTQALRESLQVDTLVAGSRLPITARTRSEDGTETVTVTLKDGKPLQLKLQQKWIASAMAGGTAEKDQAAMRLEVSYDGQRQVLGSLDQFHDWTLDFAIREVLLSPDGKQVAVLLTATKRDFEGNRARTLVQGFTL